MRFHKRAAKGCVWLVLMPCDETHRAERCRRREVREGMKSCVLPLPRSLEVLKAPDGEGEELH